MLETQTKAEAYTAWLAARQKPWAEIMAGLHASAFTPLALDIAPAMPDAPGLRYGGYDEERAIYTSPVFNAGPEPRTIHLGIDLFAPAGTAVFAPLDGRVHSFRDNAGALDYGPTIILEHAASAELVFYTLYGHLSRESLDGLHSGRAFVAGERLAWLGGADVNGGWLPHLHFQVVLDLLGYDGDFPGVARKSERARWTEICPDPGPLLGIA